MEVDGSERKNTAKRKSMAATEWDMSVCLKISVKSSATEIEKMEVVRYLSGGKGCDEYILGSDA